MHSPGVPKDQVSRISAYFDNLTALVCEPLHLVLVETKPVCASPCAPLYNFWMGFEKLLVELLRTLHAQQTTIFGAVGSEVDDSLNALHAFSHWRLVDMWPWGRLGEGCTRWEGEVETVERS